MNYILSKEYTIVGGDLVVYTKISRFTERAVSLVQTTVVREPAPAFQPGEWRYTGRVLFTLHGLREFFDHPFRWSIDLLYEIPRTVGRIDSSRSVDLKLAVYPRIQRLTIRIRHVSLYFVQLLAKLYRSDEIEVFDAAGTDCILTISHSDNRTDATFRWVKIRPGS